MVETLVFEMLETLACLIGAFVEGQWFYVMIAMKHVRVVVGLGLGLGFVGLGLGLGFVGLGLGFGCMAIFVVSWHG